MANAFFIPRPTSKVMPVMPPSPGLMPVPTLPNTPVSQITIPKQTFSKSSLSNSLLSVGTSSNVPILTSPSKSNDLMKHVSQMDDYKEIITTSSIENELINDGYTPISKIVVKTSDGDKRTQYIKAINKLGQYVFINVDGTGYTSSKTTDLVLFESKNASIVPYSLKMGGYSSAGKDVYGVAFECGTEAICVVTRGQHDLTPHEMTYTYVETSLPVLAFKDGIMSYPVIRLSEIRANPKMVLQNTDIVTSRLRESIYESELKDLEGMQHAIDALSDAFAKFNKKREEASMKIKKSLAECYEMNKTYTDSIETDDDKTSYRILRSNLAQRNNGAADLLRYIKKVADKKNEINRIVIEINEITESCDKEFKNYEYVLPE